MVAASGPHAILQVHPTRRCNLRCLHCYSNSGPEIADLLTLDTITNAVEDARGQGYEVLSVSGGEPILFRPLPQVLQKAKALGMRTTVTSNGMLLNRRRLGELSGLVDVLAISLDGVPESHNRMRASGQAFEAMQRNLAAIRNSGIDFGFIFTLTLENVNEIDWAARFALEEGAKLFQIHPLEQSGRAREMLAGSRPDEIESAYAFLEAERLRRVYGDRFAVQLDVFHREMLTRSPDRFLAGDDDASPARLADCVSPLVLEADGTVVPFNYGFGRQYAIGSVLEQPLRVAAPIWIRDRYPRLRQLCRNAFAEASRPTELPFLNWYELVEMHSLVQVH